MEQTLFFQSKLHLVEVSLPRKETGSRKAASLRTNGVAAMAVH